jgi:uncharacterized membrane protein
MVMTRRQLMRVIDTDRIEDAITRAEQGTSGEIRVSVAAFFWGRVRVTAERAFERLGMAQTRDRNGVLFFIVPSRRSFVVLGDEGIHARVGQSFWEELSAVLSPAFHEGRYTDGLVAAIERVGEHLAEHFPPHRDGGDRDELPNTVDFG